MPGNDVVFTVNEPPTDSMAAAAAQLLPIEKKKKKRSAVGLFRAALWMMRHRRGAKAAAAAGKELAIPKQKSSTIFWKKLVGSVRPLRLEEATADPPPAGKVLEVIIPPREEDAEEPMSPASHAGTMSQYASAMSLVDLDVPEDDKEEEEDDPDEVFDALCGDEMIDAKAEEFIAQFYKQIHLQNSGDRHGGAD